MRLDTQRFLSIRSAATSRSSRGRIAEDEITHLAEPINVPDADQPAACWRSIWRSITASRRASGFEGVDIAAINICNLSDAGGGAWAHTPPPGRIAIDPVLGRIFFGDSQTAAAAGDVSLRIQRRYGRRRIRSRRDLERRCYDDRAGAGAARDDSRRARSGALRRHRRNHRQRPLEETPALGIDAGARLELRAANEHRPALILWGKLEITAARSPRSRSTAC